MRSNESIGKYVIKTGTAAVIAAVVGAAVGGLVTYSLYAPISIEIRRAYSDCGKMYEKAQDSDAVARKNVEELRSLLKR